MCRLLARSARGSLLAALAASLLVGCRTNDDFSDARREGSARAPRYRESGPRMPAFSGSDPVARGWVKVDQLLWVNQDDAPAYAQGRVRDGQRLVPTSHALSHDVQAHEGFVLRTDHLVVRTNVSWDRAKGIARAAEEHLQRFMTAFGETLDLRLPQDPLPVLVIANRAEFEARLRGLVSDPVTWGAFYDSQTGEVNICAEQAARGALPLMADLRHEMTHQILDLSRPPARRGRPFPRGWFWLWEGIAVWSESLGDPPGTDNGQMRLLRFARRYEWQQWTPLVDLVALEARDFEGRHYDQVASFMRYVMAPSSRYRAATLQIVRRLLHGQEVTSLADALGAPLPQLEREWLASRGS